MPVMSVVGGAQVYSQASGGKIYAFNNIGVTPGLVAPINLSRVRIAFHNPGTVDILVAPSVVLTFPGGSNVALVPTLSALGGCWRVFANGGTREFAGECQGSWQAFAVSGTTNPLTVMDTNLL